MRTILALLILALPLTAAKKPTAAQLQVQVKKLTEERDALQQRIGAVEDLERNLVAAQKARELAKAEAAAARKEVEQVRATLRENQGGGDALLKDLESARKESSDLKSDLARIQAENDSLRKRVSAVPGEGDLVVVSEDIQPARPLNLSRITPRLKSASLFTASPKGVVVVNVLISEKGEVLASRLIQGLPGDTVEVREAGDACVESAKKLVFDPATSRDGKTRFKVWQGVGFHLE